MIDFEVRHIRVPFRFRYGHARKQHDLLEAVVCRAQDDHGRIGLGEAVPRTYVTGETCDTVIASIPPLLRQIQTATKPGERMADTFSDIMLQRQQLGVSWKGQFPSCALCVIDTAMLDLFAKQHDQTCRHWITPTAAVSLGYTASIGLSSLPKLVAALLLFRALGIERFKVKVRDADDIERIKLIRRVLGPNASLFADANAHWQREEAIRHIETLQTFGVWAIEEPLRSPVADRQADGSLNRLAALTDEHYSNYAWLRERSPLPLIADESLICLHSAAQIVEHQAFDILNIRLSKCGGPWLSALMTQMARENGLQFAVGAMVGETPILATAGAHFAAAHPDHLYVQGFSHRLLHGRRFASGEPKFRRGTIELPTCPSGLGLSLDEEKLDAITIRRESHQL